MLLKTLQNFYKRSKDYENDLDMAFEIILFEDFDNQQSFKFQ